MISDHNSIGFKAVMEKNSPGPQVKIVNWDHTNFPDFGSELVEVGWANLFSGKKMAGKWEAFKIEIRRVQVQQFPVSGQGQP